MQWPTPAASEDDEIPHLPDHGDRRGRAAASPKKQPTIGSCNLMRAAIFAVAIGVAVATVTSTPVLASPVSECNWTTNDPADVVHACTSLLAAQKMAEPWMHFNRGLAFKMLGLLDEASRDYSKAIELSPTFGAAYTNRGNVRLLRSDVRGALVDFQTALALDPNDQVAKENLEATQAALRKVGAGKSGKGATARPQ